MKTVKAQVPEGVRDVTGQEAFAKRALEQRLQTMFVDMMTLARCTFIVGTYKSSFSTLAAAFQGHIPFYVRQRAKCFLPRSIVY